MIYDTLLKTKLPVVYSHSKKGVKVPYLAYIGSGQDQFKADNTRYDYHNTYQVEYYFKKKDEKMESLIEETLLADGIQFEKSEDSYIEDEDVFVIYYQTT